MFEELKKKMADALDEERLKKDLLKMENWAIAYGAYSRSTIERAKRRLRQLAKKMDLYNLSEEALQDYVSSRLKKGATESSLNHEFKDLRVWVKYKNLDIRLPKLKESRRGEVWIPTDEEMEKIIDYAGKTPDKAAASRDSCIIEILFFGGLRIGELIKVNVEDIRPNGLYVRSEKGEMPRIVGLSDEILDDLQEYLQLYRYNSDPKAMFTTSSGRMTYPYARKRVKGIGAKASVPKFHAHAARHKCATMLLLGYRQSVPLDIRMVQIHMGHVSLSTTQQYTHVTTESVANKVRSVVQSYRGKKKTWGYVPKSTESNEPDTGTHGADRISIFEHISPIYLNCFQEVEKYGF